MARKRRDYKAEYAASKERATRAGYKSVSEYRSVRKALRLPPRTSPVPKRILEAQPGNTVSGATANANRMARLRRASRAWSDAHSKVANSRYSPRFSDAQVERYYAAFVDKEIPGKNRQERKASKADRLRQFLYPDFLTKDEWEQHYRL